MAEDASSGYSDIGLASCSDADDFENDAGAQNDEGGKRDGGRVCRRKSALAANRLELENTEAENAVAEAENALEEGRVLEAASGFEKILERYGESGGRRSHHAWLAAQSLCMLRLQECVVHGLEGASDSAGVKAGKAEALFQVFERFLRESLAGTATPNQVERGVDKILGDAVTPFRKFGSSIDFSIVESLHRLAIKAFGRVVMFSRLCQNVALRLGWVCYETENITKLGQVLRDLHLSSGGRSSGSHSVSVLALSIAERLSQGEHHQVRSMFHNALSGDLGARKPRVMGIVRECGAALSLTEHSYFEAYCGFWEAFKCYNKAGDDVQCVRCLASLVLSEMLEKFLRPAAAGRDGSGEHVVDVSPGKRSGGIGELLQLLEAAPDAQAFMGRPEMSEVFALARAVADDVIETGRLFATCKGKIDSRVNLA